MSNSFLRSPLQKRLGSGQVVSRSLLSRVKFGEVKTSFDPALLELPQHLELMAARLQNGENIYTVLTQQAVADGVLANGFRRLSVRLRLGETLDQALALLAIEVTSPLVSELANKIQLGVARGTPLASQLLPLAATAKNQLRVAQLKASGRNELRMLVPLVFLILPVTIAFAVFPSLQILQLGV